MSTDTIKKEIIKFPNENSATVIMPLANDRVEVIVDALELPAYKAIIVIIGGADNIDNAIIPKLTQVFDRGIARAAAKTNAVILDGGTQSGVMSLMGEGVANRGYKSKLIGIAPLGLVEYPGSVVKGTPLEPRHSHFVLVEGNTWGVETALLFELADKLAAPKQTSAVAAEALPRLAILVAGGDVARKEVVAAVRQNLTIVVMEGSGGLADEISTAIKNQAALADDPVIAEIIADGKIELFSLSTSVAGIERMIMRELDVDKVLLQAWETFADYDYNAVQQQTKFDRLQKTIIATGVIGTALVVIQQVFGPRNSDTSHDLLESAALWQLTNKGWWLLNHVLIIIPILITILITAATRFKQGSKWLLLRAGAESIKREIYRYRARAIDYASKGEQQLSQKLEDITRRTMRTEVNLSALKPYNKEKGFPPYMYAAEGGDDGFSFLSPDRYVEVRLTNQYNYFKKKAITYESELKIFYWATFLIGGLGTYLAAIQKQAWIALTTSLAAAIGTYLGYRQTETTLIKYNQAATDLANIRSWWTALPAEEQAKQQNVDSLVQHTEQVLQSELDGWIQQMQNALAELRKNQEQKPEKEESKGPEGAASTQDKVTVEPAAVEQEDKEQTVASAVEKEVVEAEKEVTGGTENPGLEDFQLKEDGGSGTPKEQPVKGEVAAV